jgi:hypothetical protein
VLIAGERERVYVFVATLGYSRRLHVRAFQHERQASWFDGMESAFAAFGGVPTEVLLDNARALVIHHDPVTREVQFNDRLLAFAKHWAFVPCACAPYRARTKGKDERGVGYVKHNALAGRSFASFAALEAHLEQWVREIADVRVHGTTGEAPAVRFARAEASALKSITGKPPFTTTRSLQRRVQVDCCVEVERNAYSVPWRLIGEPVQVELSTGRIRIFHAGRQVAEHAERVGRRERAVLAEHFMGVAGAQPVTAMAATANDLLRPAEAYRLSQRLAACRDARCRQSARFAIRLSKLCSRQTPRVRNGSPVDWTDALVENANGSLVQVRRERPGTPEPGTPHHAEP